MTPPSGPTAFLVLLIGSAIVVTALVAFLAWVAPRHERSIHHHKGAMEE